MPPGAINWNDADDNNAFHAKQIVMDLDGTISTEVAVLSQGKKEEYDDIVTMGLALSNDGKPVPSQAATVCGLIPKGAKNVAVAKDFLKYPDPAEGRSTSMLKTGLGPAACRRCRRSSRTTRGGSTRGSAPGGLCHSRRLLGPTVPQFWVYNPAYAQVQNEHVFPQRLGRNHAGRDGAAGGGGEGVQAGRGDLREIPDRARLSAIERRRQSSGLDAPRVRRLVDRRR